MKCTACQKELNKKETLYTEDRKPYCVNPFTCNDEHPNSVANIVARGGAIKLYTEDQLEENLFENLNVSAELKSRIEKVATKPQSIRLSKVDIAHYLIMLQETKGLSSISEAVRYCVSKTMDVEPIEEVRAAQVPDFTDVQKELLKNNTGSSIPGPIPTPIEPEIVEPVVYPVPEEEEDEFTF